MNWEENFSDILLDYFFTFFEKVQFYIRVFTRARYPDYIPS